MVAFGTAFSLNFLTLLFERESAKMQLALLACVSRKNSQSEPGRKSRMLLTLSASAAAPAQYINFLACFNDYLSWRGVSPIVRDVWGDGMQVMRILMWLHTTPAMVYLLSIISDFDRKRILKAVLTDILMITLGLSAHLSTSFLIAGGAMGNRLCSLAEALENSLISLACWLSSNLRGHAAYHASSVAPPPCSAPLRGGYFVLLRRGHGDVGHVPCVSEWAGSLGSICRSCRWYRMYPNAPPPNPQPHSRGPQ